MKRLMRPFLAVMLAFAAMLAICAPASASPSQHELMSTFTPTSTLVDQAVLIPLASVADTSVDSYSPGGGGVHVASVPGTDRERVDHRTSALAAIERIHSTAGPGDGDEDIPDPDLRM